MKNVILILILKFETLFGGSYTTLRSLTNLIPNIEQLFELNLNLKCRHVVKFVKLNYLNHIVSDLNQC